MLTLHLYNHKTQNVFKHKHKTQKHKNFVSKHKTQKHKIFCVFNFYNVANLIKKSVNSANYFVF